METQKRTAIITGSSSGLGAHIATFLNNAGFNVILNYSKSQKNAELLAKNFSKKGSILVLKGDVSKYQEVKTMIDKTIKRFGRIDVLVNNAGIHIDEKVIKMTQDSWQSVIDINLTGVFNCSKAVLPHMTKQQFGRIINISSFTAFSGIAGAANYSASKAGIIGFTKSLSKEVAKYNVTVNAIAPGYFDIGMFNDLNTETKKRILQDIPANRLGNPDEITELINILVSSNYLTGQTFVLDGGYSA